MAKGKRIGYVRVSTVDQNPDRQLEGIEIDKKFIDYASGYANKRPQLQAMIDFAREDDIIIVHSMDRLGRVVKDIIKFVDDCLKKGIQIHFVKENLLFTNKEDPLSKCILHIMSAVAEFEYSLIRERQMEGIALAKKAGRYAGRKRKLSKENIEWITAQMQTCKSKIKIAEELGICSTTLYRYLDEMQGTTNG